MGADDRVQIVVDPLTALIVAEAGCRLRIGAIRYPNQGVTLGLPQHDPIAQPGH